MWTPIWCPPVPAGGLSLESVRPATLDPPQVAGRVMKRPAAAQIGSWRCRVSSFGRPTGGGSPTHPPDARTGTPSARTKSSSAITPASDTAADTPPGLPNLRSDGVRAAAQHPLHDTRRASGSAYLQRHLDPHGGGPTAMRDGQTCGCAFGLNAVSIARHIVRKQKPSCRPAPTVCAGKCCTARSCLALRSPTCS